MHTYSYTCDICKETHSIPISLAQKEGKEPIYLVCPNVDRRYRLMGFYVDSRRSFFLDNAENSEFLEKEKSALKENLIKELGENNFDEKLKLWLGIEYPPLGLIDEYPQKIQEIINAYCSGYFYTASTATGCLGERVLNRLVLKTRKHFSHTKQYKSIHDKKSFDDWSKMIDILQEWSIISEPTAKKFTELMPYRHQAIHYNEDYDFENNARTAVNLLIKGITEIFGVINRTDLFWVFNVPGEVWVKSEKETDPFVKEFVLPHCYRAHAIHEIDFANNRIIEKSPKLGKLSDEEFISLRKQKGAPE